MMRFDLNDDMRGSDLNVWPSARDLYYDLWIMIFYENVYEMTCLWEHGFRPWMYIYIYDMIWPELRVDRSAGICDVATVGSVPWTAFWGAWTPGSRERQAWRVSPRWYIWFYSWPTTPWIWMRANVREMVFLDWFNMCFMRPRRISSEYVPD